MAKRQIIEIDREKCDGCGLCTTACAEGALVLDDENKAVLVREIFCDGLGACLDVCPVDALKVIERESEDYDAQATYKHVLATRGEDAAQQVHGIGEEHESHTEAESRPSFPSGCPGSRAMEVKPQAPAEARAADDGVRSQEPRGHWQVQGHAGATLPAPVPVEGRAEARRDPDQPREDQGRDVPLRVERRDGLAATRPRP